MSPFVCRPLYEGVDWNTPAISNAFLYAGRPLYEGVDWNTKVCYNIDNETRSPSLRGRGLKCFKLTFICKPTCRPLYEGVDWNGFVAFSASGKRCRPLYEGVDWNIPTSPLYQSKHLSPSLRGRGLKLNTKLFSLTKSSRRPLYEGVDWNIAFVIDNSQSLCRPLYEGVDWNSTIVNFPSTVTCRPLYEGVDWNINTNPPIKYIYASPSLRGRGLKCQEEAQSC